MPAVPAALWLARVLQKPSSKNRLMITVARTRNDDASLKSFFPNRLNA